jgi:hypothetical protein
MVWTVRSASFSEPWRRSHLVIVTMNAVLPALEFGETYSTLLDQAAMVQIYAELARS